MFLLLPLVLCEALPVFQSYSLDSVINDARSRPVYILALYKLPKNLNETSAVFRRLISAIPIPMDPVLGILIDPSLQRRQVIYVNEDKVRVSVNISFSKMQLQYAKSNFDGTNFMIRTKFHAMIDVINGETPVSPKKRKDLPKERKETEDWKEKFIDDKFSEKDLDGQVSELIAEKLQGARYS